MPKKRSVQILVCWKFMDYFRSVSLTSIIQVSWEKQISQDLNRLETKPSLIRLLAMKIIKPHFIKYIVLANYCNIKRTKLFSQNRIPYFFKNVHHLNPKNMFTSKSLNKLGVKETIYKEHTSVSLIVVTCFLDICFIGLDLI